jgi:hypothetical protein
MDKDSYIDLSTEFLHRFDRAGSTNDHATTNFIALDTTKEGTHVITSFGLRQVRI